MGRRAGILLTLCLLAAPGRVLAEPGPGIRQRSPSRAPAISAFTASPAHVRPHGRVVLAWKVSGATTVVLDHGLGRVSGQHTVVAPAVTTTYTIRVSNAHGTSMASLTVEVGVAPQVTSFGALPAMVAPGEESTLVWAVTGADSVTIDNGIGAVGGAWVQVAPTQTTTYTLTATNGYGQTTAHRTITVGQPPSIAGFGASPSAVPTGGASVLSWSVTGARRVSIDRGVGIVRGSKTVVRPGVTTVYQLTASNAFGTATAVTTVQAGSLPTIDAFWAMPAMAGPGVPATLRWYTTGATTVTIDGGVGVVTGGSVAVSPSRPTTYTLTASNAFGQATATAWVDYLPLATVNSQTMYSEHVLFIIPDPAQVTFTGPNSWDSVYAASNMTGYVATLKALFPADYFFVVLAANNLLPARVPNVLTYRHLADGIGQGAVTGVGVPNLTRYHIGTGTVPTGAFAVLDHEIGHNWGVNIGSEVGTGHWLANSTASGQMAATYSDDGWLTIKQIAGDATSGFTWTTEDNLVRNETETFSDHDLYLQGLGATFPDLWVLGAPVYNPDGTVGYSTATRYDQAWVEARNGPRVPTYRASEKRLRMAFVYVARDLAEVLGTYQAVELSARHFVDAEQIDTVRFRFQVPFLVATKFRASLDARLADLDGNAAPTIAFPVTSYVSSPDGNATVAYVAADPDGTAPTVTCVPAAASCQVVGSSVVLTGLPAGAHFVTIKAQDAGGKKAFAHLVVDVP